MPRTFTRVSTLFTTVGFPNRPTSTGKGGLLRGSPRNPSIELKIAVSSPQMYAPAPLRISMSKRTPCPMTSAPSRPRARAASIAPCSRSNASGDSPLGPHADGRAGSLAPAVGLVLIEAAGIDDTDPLEQPQRRVAGLWRPRSAHRGECPLWSEDCPRLLRGDRPEEALRRSGTGDRQERRWRLIAEAEARAALPGCAVPDSQGPLELRDELVRATAPAGDVVADVQDAPRARLHREQPIEGGDTPGIGWRNVQALADVREHAFADPADAGLRRLQGGEEEVTPVAPQARREVRPFALRVRGQPRGDRVAFVLVGFRFELAQIHLSSGHRLEADRARLELRGAGLGIGRVDGERVHRDLVLEVRRHEHQAGAHRGVDVDGRDDTAPTRRDANGVTFRESQTPRILARDVQGLPAP